MERTDEIRKVLRDSSKFLLSHHTEDQLDRCYNLEIGSKNLRLCSRCTGIYPGIIAGYMIYSYHQPLSFLEIFFTGLPTVIEKYQSSVKNKYSSNVLRTLTGSILGIGFVNGVLSLAENPLRPVLLAISVFYLGAALILLKLESKHP